MKLGSLESQDASLTAREKEIISRSRRAGARPRTLREEKRRHRTRRTAADASIVQGVVHQVGRRIVGQEYMVERLLKACSRWPRSSRRSSRTRQDSDCGTLAETINTSFSEFSLLRTCFCGVVGTQIYEQSNGKFSVKKGRSSPTSFSPTRSIVRGQGAGGADRGNAGKQVTSAERAHAGGAFLVSRHPEPIEQEERIRFRKSRSIVS